MDKAYVVPVFCKNCSCILAEDSMSLKTDRLLFDITEILSRNIFETKNAEGAYFCAAADKRHI